MNRKIFLTLVIFLVLPLFVLFTACNGNGGGDEDADVDVDVTPDETDVDVTPDPQPDEVTTEPEPDVEPDVEEDITVEDVEEEEGVVEVTAETVCAGQLGLICQYMETCCTVDEATTLSAFLILMGIDCTNLPASTVYMTCVLGLQDSIDEGRIELTDDPSVAQDCMEDLTTAMAECPNFGIAQQTMDSLIAEHCADLMTGLVEEDGVCIMQEDCADGHYCYMPEPDNPGTCAPIVPEDGSCGQNIECGIDFTCRGGSCVDFGGEGDDCDEIDEVEDCQIGLWCDGGSCEPMLDAGESCADADFSCEGMCSPSSTECIDFCDGV